jgi:hypothetical protein
MERGACGEPGGVADIRSFCPNFPNLLCVNNQ